MSASDFHPALHDTLNAACEKALGYHVQGHLDLAEEVYRAVLHAQPNHATGNYALGMLTLQTRAPQEAMPLLETAIGAEPHNLEYWQGYLEALIKADKLEMAAQILKVALAYGLAPSPAEGFAARLGKFRPALAPRSNPGNAGAADATGVKRRTVKGLVPSRECIQHIEALLRQGNRDQSLFLARLLTQEFPQHGFGWKVVGAIEASFKEHRPSSTTLEALRHASELLPDDAEAAINYCYALTRADQRSLAKATLEQVVARFPNNSVAVGMLGAAISGDGDNPEFAMELMTRAVKLDPTNSQARSVRLFMLLETPDLDPAMILAEHRKFDAMHGKQWVKHWPRHTNARDPGKRLKIGLVSGDLNDHSVAYFIEPIIAGFSRKPDYELHVYYNNTGVDGVTEYLQGLVAHWTMVHREDDGDLAARIQQDGIDILVDLSGHTALNRLLTFVRKPAPLQVSWIGYPGTTGLQAMDYLLGDPYYLPPGKFDSQFTEKLVYLPSGDPYRPPEVTPDVNVLPALATGHLTFASLNRPSKITLQAVAVWCALLRAVPDARLLMGHLTGESLPPRLAQAFADGGITADRIVCHRKVGMDKYLALHHQIDICLDTFPYNGGTTVNTATWMGVPTITIAGATPAGHQAASCLLKLGLDRFVTRDAEAFVAEGIYWAQHLDELAALRAGMRQRVRNTPGRQAEVIVAGLDRAFRQMWGRWCAGQAAESFSVA